ncbi:MAG: hypothetical protein AABX25_04555 [Nanoarchaeota archaeon]
MNPDEDEFEKLRKFSVVNECPRCGHLSLTFKNNMLHCANCGYAEKIPTLR